MTLSPRPWISLPAGASQIHYSCLRVTQSGQVGQQSATLTLPRCPDQDPLCNNACWPLTGTRILLVLRVPKGYKGRRILRWRVDFQHRARFPRHEIRTGIIRSDYRITTFEVTVYDAGNASPVLHSTPLLTFHKICPVSLLIHVFARSWREILNQAWLQQHMCGPPWLKGEE